MADPSRSVASARRGAGLRLPQRANQSRVLVSGDGDLLLERLTEESHSMFPGRRLRRKRSSSPAQDAGSDAGVMSPTVERAYPVDIYGTAPTGEPLMIVALNEPVLTAYRPDEDQTALLEQGLVVLTVQPYDDLLAAREWSDLPVVPGWEPQQVSAQPTSFARCSPWTQARLNAYSAQPRPHPVRDLPPPRPILHSHRNPLTMPSATLERTDSPYSRPQSGAGRMGAHLRSARGACDLPATLAPGVYGFDSAELATGAYTLGDRSPDGVSPVPAGHARLHVSAGVVDCLRRFSASAVFGAGSVFLVSTLVKRLTGGNLTALFAGLVLAFSISFWKLSVVAEVYTLHVFLLALTMVLGERALVTRQPLWLAAMALVFGLSRLEPRVGYSLYAHPRVDRVPVPAEEGMAPAWPRSGRHRSTWADPLCLPASAIGGSTPAGLRARLLRGQSQHPLRPVVDGQRTGLQVLRLQLHRAGLPEGARHVRWLAVA